MTKKPQERELRRVLDQLVEHPDSVTAASARRLLGNISDPDILANLLRAYHLELSVAEAIEPRLELIAPDHEAAWELMALTHVMNLDGRQETIGHASSVVSHLLRINPRNLQALDAALLLRTPAATKNKETLIELARRYFELYPDSARAIAFYAKALLAAGESTVAQDVLRRLSETLQDEMSKRELREEVMNLLQDIESGKDVMRSWP